jgi:uncharacterized protein YqhQ
MKKYYILCYIKVFLIILIPVFLILICFFNFKESIIGSFLCGIIWTLEFWGYVWLTNNQI